MFAVLAAAGFGAGGVAAGSAAAAVQATIGNVAAGSLFAACQSAGKYDGPICLLLFVLSIDLLNQ